MRGGDRERQSERIVMNDNDPDQLNHEHAFTNPPVWSNVSCRPDWASSSNKCKNAALRDSTEFVIMDLFWNPFSPCVCVCVYVLIVITKLTGFLLHFSVLHSTDQVW